jgi:hypothetical protein
MRLGSLKFCLEINPENIPYMGHVSSHTGMFGSSRAPVQVVRVYLISNVKRH